MTEFKFEYSPSRVQVPDLLPLFELCAEYRKMKGPPPLVGFEKEVNLLCRLDFMPGRKTLNDVREHLKGTEVFKYVQAGIDQADEHGIKTISTFRAWVQGSDSRLPIHPINKLSSHTHPFRLPQDLDPVNTYTIISSLRIDENITEQFWAKWIDDVTATVPPEWFTITPGSKVAEIFFHSEKMKEKIMNWWEALRETTPGKETLARLPKAGEQMTVNFNSKNWLHGIDGVGNNLYLYMLFDDYTI